MKAAKTIRLFGEAETTHAEGDRLIMNLPFKVAIWTDAEWRAVPRERRPAGVTRVGPYWLDARMAADARRKAGA